MINVPKETKLSKTEPEKVVGGGFGNFTPSDMEKIREEAAKRGTCLRCGRRFEECRRKFEISKIKLCELPTMKFACMDAYDAQYLGMNYCADCLSLYGSDEFFKNHK